MLINLDQKKKIKLQHIILFEDGTTVNSENVVIYILLQSVRFKTVGAHTSPLLVRVNHN